MQLREFHQHVGHLISALAAAHIHDDIRVGPLGQLMLNHGFAAAKGAGHRGHAAPGDGEKGIDDPLAGDHGLAGRDLFPIGTSPANRPFLHHGKLFALARRGFQSGNRFDDGMFPLADPFQSTLHPGRHHDLMQNHRGFLNRAQYISGPQPVAHLGQRLKHPFFLMI